MKHASTAPSLAADIHLVLRRFGRAGLAYAETEPADGRCNDGYPILLYGRSADTVEQWAAHFIERHAKKKTRENSWRQARSRVR